MCNQRQPCFPAIGSTIKALDPGPSIGLNTSQFQYLKHLHIVTLEVLALKWHLETSHLVVIKEQLVGAIPFRAYNKVNWDLGGSHNCA